MPGSIGHHEPGPNAGAEAGRLAELGRREQSTRGTLGLVASGVVVWGGVGWLVSKRLDNRVYLMLGILVARLLRCTWCGSDTVGLDPPHTAGRA